MTPQELQSQVLDYLSKNVDKGYYPVIKVTSTIWHFRIEVYIVGEVLADKEDVYIEDPIRTLYDPESDDLYCILELIASEIRMHEIEDNRRYDETGASY